MARSALARRHRFAYKVTSSIKLLLLLLDTKCDPVALQSSISTYILRELNIEWHGLVGDFALQILGIVYDCVSFDFNTPRIMHLENK